MEAFFLDLYLNHVVSNIFAHLRHSLKIAAFFANVPDNLDHTLRHSMIASLPLPQRARNCANDIHLVIW